MRDAVQTSRLEETVREFSGEDSTTVGGERVLIAHRISPSGNDLAADYLQERLTAMGLETQSQQYRASGRNIVAIQRGQQYPDSLYVISAHYDAVAAYCADDNASGVAAILEAARLLAPYCLDKTLVYAFWDEEEIGLRGSRYFADSASAAGLTIAGVLNLDMIGYDADDDRLFDIDTRNDGKSEHLAASLAALAVEYDLDLVPNTVNPGTWASDHASFWRNDYAAVLLGEAWSTDDYNAAYHTANDRIGLFNLPYFREMSALALLWAASSAGLSGPDASVTVSDSGLVAPSGADAYQWLDCGNGYAPVPGALDQVWPVPAGGSYAVWITVGDCSTLSPCEEALPTGLGTSRLPSLKAWPNPAWNHVFLEGPDPSSGAPPARLEIRTLSGSLFQVVPWNSNPLRLQVADWPAGIYLARPEAWPEWMPVKLVVH